MNFMIFNRTNGNFSVTGEEGVIRHLRIGNIPENMVSSARKSCAKLSVGEYFYIGSFIITGVTHLL